MKYTIKKLTEKLTYLDDNKKLISYNGYAFMDENNRCIIIAYGENRRDSISELLNEGNNNLGIIYKYIDLKK